MTRALAAVTVVALFIAVWWLLDGTHRAPRARFDAPGAPSAAPATDAGAAGLSASEDAPEDKAKRDDVAAPDRRVLGRVLRNGVPVGGVRVRVRSSSRVLGTDTSAPDGRFALRTEAAGSLHLELTGVGATVVAEPRWVKIAGDAPTDLGDLELGGGHRVVGRVVDPDGTPLAGARVFFAGESFGYHDFARSARIEDAEPHVPTDGGGHFAIPFVADGCYLCLWIEHDACLPQRLYRRITTALDLGAIPLQRGHGLTGRVVGRDGPLAGARVAPLREPRKAVTTNGHGEFTLDGVGFGELSVAAAGYVPARAAWTEDTILPLLVELVPTGRVDVRVANHQGGHLAVETHGPGSSAYGFTRNGDGGFSGTSLAPGAYRIRVWSHPFGKSEVVDLDLEPGDHEVVELTIAPHPTVVATVVDEHSRPLEGARVTCEMSWYRESGLVLLDDGPPQRGETDAAGQVRFALPAFADVKLDATLDGYLPARLHVGEAERAAGTPLRIVMSEVSEPEPTGVLAVRVDGDEPDVPAAIMVRRRGEKRFVALRDTARERGAELAAGDYELRLGYVLALSGSRFVPDPRTTTEVTIRAGETSEATIAAAQLGRIRMRAVAGGQPVAGARITAVSVRDGRDCFGYDHRFTDERGELVLATLAPGAWRFDARRGEHALPSAAREVRLRGLARSADVVLELGTATVRGRFDLSWIEGRLAELIVTDRDSFLTAYLFRASEAGSDAFWRGHHATSQASAMFSATPDERGAFEFIDVPPGTSVLRIVTSLDEIQHQRVLEIPAHGELDLGAIARDPRVDATVRCVDPAGQPHPRLGAWVRRPDPAVGPPGVFVTTAGCTGGALELHGVPPGAYELEFFAPFDSRLRSSGLNGKSLGIVRSIQVDTDGGVTPAELGF